MTPWIYGLGGTLIAGALFGWTVRDWKADSDTLAATAAANERYDERVEEAAARSVAYEELAQQIRATERVDRVQIKEIYRDVEVPADCAVPDDARSLLDDAVRRANNAATGQSLDAVSDAATAPEPID